MEEKRTITERINDIETDIKNIKLELADADAHIKTCLTENIRGIMSQLEFHEEIERIKARLNMNN